MISAEISYYPLGQDYNLPISEFIERLKQVSDVKVESGIMSTIITGEYQNVMETLNQLMGDFFDRYSSVFMLKLSNSCPI